MVLPSDWLEIEIGQVSDVVAGGTPKAGDPTNFTLPGTSISWLTPADLSGYKSKFISHGKRDLSQKGLDSSSAKLMPKGSVLFSSRAPIGYVVIANNEISTNQGFKSFVFPEGVDPSFAYYYLRSIRDIAESRGSGTTFKELSGANAKKLPFILAPYEEQKQIATKLDELLVQVDTIKTRLDAIPTILKRFRQSVLSVAVSGKLTEVWRGENKYKNISLADENIQLPESWAIETLANLINPNRNLCYGVVQPGSDVKDGVEMIRVGDINGGKIDWFSLKRISKEIDNQYKRSKVQKGDVLVTIVGAIGRIGIVDRDVNINIARAVARISPNINLVHSKYMQIWLSAPELQWWLVNSSKEVARKTLNLKELKEAVIGLPEIEEQTEIVRRVEELFTFTDLIEQRIKDAQSRVNHLTQSILAKAFRGELTAEWREQNPDLVSGENSAEALLGKIKAERAQAEKQKKPVRRTIKKKSNNTMKPKEIIPIVEALKSAKNQLTSQQLLAESGYPIDASVEQLESFFLDIREQVGLGVVHRERRGDDEFITLVD